MPLLERKREILAGQAKERQKGGQGGVLLPANLPEATKETRDAVAAEIGTRAREDHRQLVDLDLDLVPTVLTVVIEAGYRSTTARLPMGGGFFVSWRGGYT